MSEVFTLNPNTMLSPYINAANPLKGYADAIHNGQIRLGLENLTVYLHGLEDRLQQAEERAQTLEASLASSRKVTKSTSTESKPETKEASAKEE